MNLIDYSLLVGIHERGYDEATVRAAPGQFSALSIFHSKSVLYIWCVCMGARGA